MERIERKMAAKLKLSIVMPVRNEGVNLSIMLKIIKALVDVPYEVLIVYDTPDDDSIKVAEKLQKVDKAIRPLHNQLGRGVINAVRSGVAAAKSEYIFILPADDIGPVSSINKMVELMDRGYDMINLTRYSKGGTVMGGAWSKLFLSWLANKLFRVFAGSSLTDTTYGVKMFRKSMFGRLRLTAKPVGWAFAFEMGMKAQLVGFRIKEIPAISINRFYAGQSTFTLKAWIFEYIRWFLWGLKRTFKLRRAKIE
jgi:dolichol-phosphate mannosyltransferase